MTAVSTSCDLVQYVLKLQKILSLLFIQNSNINLNTEFRSTSTEIVSSVLLFYKHFYPALEIKNSWRSIGCQMFKKPIHGRINGEKVRHRTTGQMQFVETLNIQIGCHNLMELFLLVTKYKGKIWVTQRFLFVR